MGYRQTVPLIAGLALIALLGAAMPASGAIVTDNLVDVHANAKYSVTYDNAIITVAYNATDVGSQQGTVTFSTTWGVGDSAARSVVFKQTDPPADPPGGEFGNDEGLRLQLVLNLDNNTGVSWTSFGVSTVDNSIPAGGVGPGIGGETSHRRKAHFHGTLVLTGTNFNASNAYNNTQKVLVSGGLHDSGTLGMSGFFMHERNLTNNLNKAVKREFTLVLTPNQAVPEPASLALLGFGSLVLMARRMGGRRGAGHQRKQD